MATKTAKPFIDQYHELKAAHPGSILMFRVGDFYELYGEDARTTAKIIGLTVTTRDPGGPKELAMAGFPYHQLDNYLRKMIQAGQRVSVCEYTGTQSDLRPQ